MEGENAGSAEKIAPEPNIEKPEEPLHIRTMASDLLLHPQKPSDPLPVAPQPTPARETPRVKMPVFALLGILVIVLGGGAYMYRSYYALLFTGGTPTVKRPGTPAPFFGIESTRELTINEGNKNEFSSVLKDAFASDERRGTFKRVIIVIKTETEDRYAELKDLFSLFGIPPPSLFFTPIEKPLMTFAYYGNDGPHFGFAVTTNDRERVLAAMSRWEETLPTDFTPLFLDASILPKPGVFEEYVYRNTTYKFLQSPQDQNRGIAYLVFPAGKYLIVTTSRESMERAIERLFNAL